MKITHIHEVEQYVDSAETARATERACTKSLLIDTVTASHVVVITPAPQILGHLEAFAG
jgi:hypothetical protein